MREKHIEDKIDEYLDAVWMDGYNKGVEAEKKQRNQSVKRS